MTGAARRPRVVIVSDRIDGLDSAAAGAALARGWSPRADVAVVPVAVGGPPLATALATLESGTVTIDGARWYASSPRSLVVGLTEPDRDAWAERASSFDLGRWTRARLAAFPPVGRVILDLTGITAHDAGAGLLAGLGAGGDGDLTAGLAALDAVTRIDLSAVRTALTGRDLIAVVDPSELSASLVGLRGTLAARAFRARIDPARLLRADAAVSRWGNALGPGLVDAPGAGAAGGLGLAVLALGGGLTDGVGLCADTAGLTATLAAADLVVSGCDSFDIGNHGGSVVSRVAGIAEAALRPCIVFASTAEVSRREMRAIGVEAAYPVDPGPDAAQAITTAAARVAAGWFPAVGGGS